MRKREIKEILVIAKLSKQTAGGKRKILNFISLSPLPFLQQNQLSLQVYDIFREHSQDLPSSAAPGTSPDKVRPHIQHFRFWFILTLPLSLSLSFFLSFSPSPSLCMYILTGKWSPDVGGRLLYCGRIGLEDEEVNINFFFKHTLFTFSFLDTEFTFQRFHDLVLRHGIAVRSSKHFSAHTSSLSFARIRISKFTCTHSPTLSHTHTFPRAPHRAVGSTRTPSARRRTTQSSRMSSGGTLGWGGWNARDMEKHLLFGRISLLYFDLKLTILFALSIFNT